MNSTILHRSGFVAVMGKPNVGKSTLLNRLLNQKIAAVSPKPQTTRLQQFGILTLPDAQIVFIDTPGLHHPQHKLGEYMNQDARLALEDADIALLVLDGNALPSEEDHLFSQLLQELDNIPPVFLVLNKLDKLSPDKISDHTTSYQALLPEAELITVSALTGKNLAHLLSRIIDFLPEGPQFYPEDQITDIYERDIAADMIRAAAMLHLQHELPHVIAVRIDEYKERQEHGAYIEATLFVERDSQKGILIGEGGNMIKRIGSTARKDIESMSGRKVFLKLRVKVKKNWRNDINALRLFGFKK
ncbi:MAG: GTPase Era [Anaerolineales bacterium]|nr:GTPase Era [Anaerolineales bacterium]